MLGTSPILIAGTDTGVGKTWVACALALALRANGQRVVGLKPVETDCSGAPAPHEDGVRLAAATGQPSPGCALVRLPEPLAPAVAAERAGVRLEFDDLVQQVLAAMVAAEVALIEGAGGLLTPLVWGRDLLDLGHRLGARVLLVAANRLGTINHTLLALGALDARGLPALGVVLGHPAPGDVSVDSNAAAITRARPGTRLVELPHSGDPATLARHLTPVLSWLSLPEAPAGRAG